MFRGLIGRGPADPLAVAYDTVVRLVTIAEIFAGERLVDIVEQRLPDEDLVLDIWDERSARITRDWSGRRAGWNQLFQIKWTYPQPGKAELDGFILARNVIVHGLGQLTRSQLRRGTIIPEIREKLLDAHLHLRGQALIVEEPDVVRCAMRVVDFVKWLDGRAGTVVAP